MCFLEILLPNANMYKESPRQSILLERGKGILHLEWRTGFSKVENQMLNKTLFLNKKKSINGYYWY